jgi:DNA-binding MarR family transcriptional regulator
MSRPETPIDEIVRDCLAVRVRLIGRAVTGIYDRAMSTHGVTVAQINLLAALGKIGPCPPSRLGELLQLERSTVSRNLDILLEKGWVRATSSDAKGVREVMLAPAGVLKVASIMADWRTAQAEASRLLGDSGMKAIRAVADSLWGAAGQH